MRDALKPVQPNMGRKGSGSLFVTWGLLDQAWASLVGDVAWQG